ncbi:tetraacyldisaccharide 4'-kinase [Empedobacter falsenii]|uniref:Tetraacyldisaccharide 4'-kinase n=1 Tax=Empedobacter falsenii TaxID=343874 RepID=A0ABY8V8T4_9FLAO|nr:tetraacyldisaccharide 4'-kinase [Empedobacter falsenii]WIH97789.1 tetraacyldisaccharide 4'-kinase [Empedobacter falsenii]HJD85878.1 tetraacyldisaccharide 4'-kinase [Empedobacter falsenii]
MNWRRFLLPFSGLYWIGTSVRNLFYNIGMMRSTSFNIPIINVGNLSVGGTGKSPHIMYLIDLLKDEKLTATLSRGYGRKTKGFLIANYSSKVYDIGDEPMQFFQRFKNRILIAVCEERVFGAHKLIDHYKSEVILLDDAYQHRAIKAGFNIMLTDFNNPYYKDFLLPAGDLRESGSGVRRADIVIVTKCPDRILEEKHKEISKRIKLKSHQQLFFSKIVYDNKLIGRLDDVEKSTWKNLNVILVTGIAKTDGLVKFAEENFANVLHLEYPDHHNFSQSEIEYIYKRYEDTEGRKRFDKIIMTTEKDFMRLMEESMIKDDLYYIPIRIEINDKEKFNQTILEYVGKN